MSPESHIFEWAYNSQPLWKRMKDLQRRMEPGALDCYLTPTGNAAGAFSIACASVAEMIRGGEISRDEYSARDILAAAILILGWSGEE